MMYDFDAIERFVARFYGNKSFTIVPYAYNLIFLALAQNGVSSQNLQIAANADFFALGLRHRAQIGAAQTVSTITAPFVRALFVDAGSNEQWTNQSVDLNNYGPAAAFNFPFPYPRVISGRSSVAITLTNYAPTAETYTSIELSLWGVLVRVTN